MKEQELDLVGASSSAISAPWAEVNESVKEEEVKMFGVPTGEVEQEALSGNGFTYRHDWGDKRGGWKLRLNWGSVNPRSRVFVAIAEGAPGGPDAGKFIGAAKYTLHNVAPRSGGVDIWVNIDWSSNIRIYVDYLVVNP